jgi:hypothetical protein
MPSASCYTHSILFITQDAFYKLTNARSQIESYVYDVVRSSVRHIYG